MLHLNCLSHASVSDFSAIFFSAIFLFVFFIAESEKGMKKEYVL